MNIKSTTAKVLEGSHLVLLISYTLFAVILMVEDLLMGWETWPILLVLISVITSWFLHITERFAPEQRLWLYAMMMMAIFFFYGIHETSTYDLVGVVLLLIMLFSMTLIPGLINLCMVTYYLAMIYNLVNMTWHGMEWDALTISRTLLHFVLVLVGGSVAKFIVERWLEIYQENQDRITELKDVNRRTEDFLTNVSHEIRTPINAVMGLSGILLKKERNEALRQDLLSVQEAGHRVSDQISDILDFTEIDMGSLVLTRENYMITSLVNDFVSEYNSRQRDLELIIDLDASVPSVLVGDSMKIKKILWHLVSNGIKFTRNGCVYIRIRSFEKPYGINLFMEVRDTGRGMDPGEIEKIYQKFYQSNSGRARQAGGLGLGLSIVYGFVRAMGGFLTIESERGSGTRVQVTIPQEVSNKEPCMSIENKERMCLAVYSALDQFEVPRVREYYNEMLAHMVGGLDCPMHLVGRKKELLNLQKAYSLTHLFVGRNEYEEDREYLESLAGQMELIIISDGDYELRPGSRAKVLKKPFYSLPIVSLLNTASGKGLILQERAQFYCPGVKALVVDDEPMNLLVAEGIFRDYGMEVTTAESGFEALDLCKKHPFDLVFMDHMMPEMDGVECMHHLRAMGGDKGKDLTIIALTANAVSSARDMFLSEGFDGFVSKPIEFRELERTLKRLLPKSAISYDYQPEEETAEANKESAQTDPMDLLFRVGVDIHEGLGYCRNDRAFYRTLLTKYVTDAPGKIEKLSSYFHEEDWKNYQILVHALKSNSKMIGAIELSEKARLLEEAAKDLDADYIRSGHDSLINDFTLLSSGMGELLGEAPGKTEESGGDEIAEGALLESLKEIAGFLKTFEGDKAEELLNELAGYSLKDSSMKDSLRDITALVGDFELDEALAKTEEVIAALEKESRA